MVSAGLRTTLVGGGVLKIVSNQICTDIQHYSDKPSACRVQVWLILVWAQPNLYAVEARPFRDGPGLRRNLRDFGRPLRMMADAPTGK